MTVGFALHYLFALGVVALLLIGLNAAARIFARGRATAAQTKTVRILDSVALTKQASLHIAGVEGGRRYLVGTGGNRITLLAELEVREARDLVCGGFGEVDLGVGSE